MNSQVSTPKYDISRFSMRIAGSAGDGLQSTGKLLQKYLNRIGYYVVGHPGTQSTIRGGHVWQHVEFSSHEMNSFDRKIDLLIALNSQSIEIHLQDLQPQGYIIYNSDKINLENTETGDKTLIPISLSSITRSIDLKTAVLANTVAIGVIISLLNLPKDQYIETLSKRFANKTKILDMNKSALLKGIEYLQQHYDISVVSLQCAPPTLVPHERIVISGNEMIALGAVASGLKFLAQYPITPASSILTYIANRAEDLKIVVKQAEDEISAICMLIGASFAGARVMTATSGPGISLMSEAFGYAAMTETPIVVVNAMRAGPSTGVPTKMEQADLLSMIHLSHGESPRAVFAPRNIQEAFEVTVRAFNLADEFQIPVIILSDFALSERTENLEPFDLNVEINRGLIWSEPSEQFPTYKRYQLTTSGISPRAFPMTKNAEYILVGAEHDEQSHSLSGNRCGLPLSGELREKMFEKRFKKLELLRERMLAPEYYGVKDADNTLLCWGSTQGAMMETVDKLNTLECGSWNMLSFVDIFPLPYSKIKPLLHKIKFSIMFEVNYTGQLELLLHHHLDWKPDKTIHPLSGETPTPTSIITELSKIMDIGRIN